MGMYTHKIQGLVVVLAIEGATVVLSSPLPGLNAPVEARMTIVRSAITTITTTAMIIFIFIFCHQYFLATDRVVFWNV